MEDLHAPSPLMSLQALKVSKGNKKWSATSELSIFCFRSSVVMIGQLRVQYSYDYWLQDFSIT